jgi:hypothetical protein
MHLCSDAFPTTCRLPPYPLQCLGESLAAETTRPLRELADDEVCLLLAGARSTEGHVQDIHLCVTGAGAPRLTSHLATFPICRRLDQDNVCSEILRLPL